MIYSPDNREVFVDYSLVPANPNAEQAIQIIFNELSQTNAYRKSDRRKFKAAALPLIADLLSNPNRWHIYSRNE
jgi:ribosomal protein S2